MVKTREAGSVVCGEHARPGPRGAQPRRSISVLESAGTSGIRVAFAKAILTTANRIAGRIALGSFLCGVASLSGQPQTTNPLRQLRLSVPKVVPHRPVQTSASSLPSVIFWAWERSEDLSFLDPEKAGVAFLAKTIYLQPPGAPSSANPRPRMTVRPRLQPLHVSPGTVLIAVARIENSSTPLSDAVLQAEIAAQISSLQDLPGVSAVQIDFDATSSQREFYSALLQDVRRQLPSSMPLSITALGS